jgi:hypothetical protein
MQRFDFEHWPRPAAVDVKFFIWRLAISPHLLRDSVLARVQDELLADDCRYITSIWRPKAGAALVRLDVYEEPSRQAAELRLLDLLANFQSPLLLRDPNAAYPFFRFGDDATFVLTRGNLTFFAANAERKTVSLKTVVADIDQLFTASPAKPTSTVVPVLKLTEPASVRANAAVPLVVDADYPLPCWFLIETKLGELHREGPRLKYQASNKGPETLHITAIAADGHSTSVERTFTVS